MNFAAGSDQVPNKIVLLLGLGGVVVAEVESEIDTSGLHLIGGGNIDDVRTAFAAGRVDHVIMGAGIDLESRLEIVREVFQSSDATTMHMKDRVTGPDGFLPFIRSILRGLSDYEPR